MAGEGLQGMQPKLPPVLRLHQHPIVIPVGQHVGRQGHNGARAKIAWRWRHCRVQQPPGECFSVMDVNGDTLSQTELKLAGRQGRPRWAPQPGQSCTQTNPGRCSPPPAAAPDRGSPGWLTGGLAGSGFSVANSKELIITILRKAVTMLRRE